ncbi:hypothetical protein I0Q91_07720 [Halanaerobiaceae bacterium Z-7014]|uniref:Glutamate synthase alpha subunit C-terminal domain-containing protein n=1 Tax=Halonatronomonas betaini TaxID=2778430 RepID=A0A931AUL0_9FIRM|nr:hypothetical protein [Halonatronomonas betaini]MBF8436959.1 hypothetical protein [Halonatronomonas betaini]
MVIRDSSVINGYGLGFKKLNQLIREKIESGQEYFQLEGINGQRYIGSGLGKDIEMEINGLAGNDLAAFADGVMIRVNDSVQDCVGNTMNAGKIIIDGHAGDLPGYSQRGGSIYINGDAGYRAGIHMKGFKDKQPLLIIGGKAGDFTGEYMAGGRIIVLGVGLEKAGSNLIGDQLAPGMHGGQIFIRGKLSSDDLGPEIKLAELNQGDLEFLEREIENFKDYFNYKSLKLDLNSFSKIIPNSNRPYGNMYV